MFFVILFHYIIWIIFCMHFVVYFIKLQYCKVSDIKILKWGIYFVNMYSIGCQQIQFTVLILLIWEHKNQIYLSNIYKWTYCAYIVGQKNPIWTDLDWIGPQYGSRWAPAGHVCSFICWRYLDRNAVQEETLHLGELVKLWFPGRVMQWGEKAECDSDSDKNGYIYSTVYQLMNCVVSIWWYKCIYLHTCNCIFPYYSLGAS